MSGLAFVTHPSVRIKGSENVYTPVQCMDQNCPIKAPHLHCPFCVKTDVYQDPVILKAHYRVKHVDKGIEFAGLKILRCCDHCDIVGVIKGEKKFKGAHWHCYRCRNGFNRRDEAIKHYKTHFRNPQTTFQISITQDLNTPVQYNPEKRGDLHSSDSNPSTCITTSSQEVIHPALTQAVSCISSPITVSEHEVASSTVSMSNGKMTDGALHVSIAANETIDAEEDDNTQTIMIIQEEQLDSSQMDSAFPTHIIANENVGVVGENRLYVLQNVGHKMGGSDKFRGSLVEECQRLQEEKMILKSEVEELHKHIQNLEEELILSKKREEELMARLCNASERGVQEVLQQLESEHRALLHRHLDHLQQTIFASRSQSVLQLTDSTGQEIQVVNAASLEAFLAGNMTTSPAISSTGDHNHIPSNSTTIITAEELELEQVSINHSTAVEETIASKTSNTIGGTTNYIMCVQNVKTEDRGDSEVGTTIEVNPEEMLTNADEEHSVAEEDEPQIKRQKLQCS